MTFEQMLEQIKMVIEHRLEDFCITTPRLIHVLDEAERAALIDSIAHDLAGKLDLASM